LATISQERGGVDSGQETRQSGQKKKQEVSSSETSKSEVILRRGSAHRKGCKQIAQKEEKEVRKTFRRKCTGGAKWSLR